MNHYRVTLARYASTALPEQQSTSEERNEKSILAAEELHFEEMYLSRLERLLGFAGVFFAPFWVFDIGIVNLTLMDISLIALAGIAILKRREIPLFPTKAIGGATLLFLFAAGGSIVTSPSPLRGILGYLQYLLVFAVLIPALLLLFHDRRRRWYGLLTIALALNVVVVAGISELVFTEAEQVLLWYGNINQAYWIISAAVLVNSGIVLSNAGQPLRMVAGICAITALALVIDGIGSLSAPLMVVSGMWLLIFQLVTSTDRNRIERQVFLGATVVGGIVVLLLGIKYWPFLYRQGTLSVRFWQIQIGTQVGLTTLPFGVGLDSAELILSEYPNGPNYPIHNGLISFLMETGPLGFVAALLLSLYWLRDVVVRSLLDKWEVYEYVPVITFSAYLTSIAPFQPVPPRRLWWVFFVIGFAIAADYYRHSAQTDTPARSESDTGPPPSGQQETASPTEK